MPTASPRRPAPEQVAVRPAPPAASPRTEAVAAVALAVVRRALSEDGPVTRHGFAQEAAFALGTPPEDALLEVDRAAQRLGVSLLS